MAEREQPRALVLLRIVADGLRDPIRHVKYPDEERCARCGGKWPCPNGAFDELREEIKRLACDAQLQQAQEEARVMQLMGIRARRNEKQAQAERDEAIERGEQVYEYGLYLISLTRLAEASRWLIGTRLRTERERAEAAEALVEDLVKALTQVRDEMVTCTEWREDDPLYRIADDILAHVEAPAQRGAP